MTVHRNRFLVNKTNRCTEFQFSGITTLHVSGSLSAYHQEFLAVHDFGTFYAVVMTVCYQEQDGTACSSILLLVANGYHNCIKCTKVDVRLRTPDDRQKGCPKHVES